MAPYLFRRILLLKRPTPSNQFCTRDRELAQCMTEGGWVSENAFLFDAKFSDLPDVEIQ